MIEFGTSPYHGRKATAIHGAAARNPCRPPMGLRETAVAKVPPITITASGPSPGSISQPPAPCYNSPV